MSHRVMRKAFHARVSPLRRGQQLKDKLIEHKQYIDKHGEDLPEVRNWKWSNPNE